MNTLESFLQDTQTLRTAGWALEDLSTLSDTEIKAIAAAIRESFHIESQLRPRIAPASSLSPSSHTISSPVSQASPHVQPQRSGPGRLTLGLLLIVLLYGWRRRGR